MDEHTKSVQETTLDLTKIIETALKIPGVKVSREGFLREQFKNCTPDEINNILEKGPVEAGFSNEELKKKAIRLIKEKTAIATGGSFLAGIPGGIAMAVTLPADIVQFYCVALSMAQGLVYLYGERDIWCENAADSDHVTNQLILYCGVMLGAAGADAAVRVMSAALAKQALKKLPQMALTKTLYYPVIKSTLKFFGLSITKSSFAKGVSKALPVVGGVVSGGITLASMYPMGKRLMKVLDEAHFDYTQEEFDADMQVIEACEADEPDPNEEIYKQIENARKMLDNGIISEAGFAEIERKLIEKIQ